jgi:NADH-quinone oxidoreductase subunit M
MMEVLALNLLIFLPLLAALAIVALPQRREHAAAAIALWTGLIALAAALHLWVSLPAALAAEGPAALLGRTNVSWISVGEQVTVAGQSRLDHGLELRYHVGLDALSLPLVALTALLVPLSVLCSLTAIRTRLREYYAWLMLLTAAMFGVFAARDLLLFYIFFEFTLVPLYFLIGVWGGSERRYAANKFFLFTFVGSVVTFAGIVYLAIRAAQIANRGLIHFDLLEVCNVAINQLSLTEQSLLFIAFFCGFAIKVPLFPLHTWLPLAHTEAPTAGSVLLAGVLLKLGTYGFLRVALPAVPLGVYEWAQALAALAVIGVVYGALCCWVQSDVKKLVAYSSVSHLGFCMLGMFALTPIGLSGSVLYMINHGLSTGALFLIVGMIYERYHTRNLDEIGGLARPMPVMAFFLVFFTLSSIGLPGLNGFVSEFTTLFAAFNSTTLGPWYGGLGAAGILLGAIYMLYAIGKVLFGPLKQPPHTPDLSAGLARDLNAREILILTPLAVLCLYLGVWPRAVTDRLDPLLQTEILARFETQLRPDPSYARADADADLTAPAAQFAGGDGRRAAQASASLPAAPEQPAAADQNLTADGPEPPTHPSRPTHGGQP